MNPPPRIPLARLPTPLERSPRLGAEVGLELLWKRDDLTGLELSGNKARKLEFLVADAEARGADTLVTCGGAQSNHCRATAFAAAKRGLRCVVLLRVPDPSRPPVLEANSLLDHLAGAEIRWVSPAEYAARGALLGAVAHQLRDAGRRPYVILEGGSSALGAWGYVVAVEELWSQLPEDWRKGPVTLAYACGSGGTGAGIELGIRRIGWQGARPLGFAVCNDAEYFQNAISGICIEAEARWAMDAPRREAEIAVDDGFIGPGYALATDEGLEVIRHAARADGVILDPVYTGKAMQGLITRRRERSPLVADRAVFIHTGGAFGIFPLATRLAAG